MNGLMMDFQLTIPVILKRAEALFGKKEIVTRMPDKRIHRYTYDDMARRSKKLAVALQHLGVRLGDRVATLCWNHHAHLEAYFAIPCIGAVLHTLNVRLSGDDLTYIVRHARDRVIIVDQVLLPLLEKFKASINVPHILVIPQTEESLPPGYLNYEHVLASGDEQRYLPFEGDENTAACLCYTSGTTGKPKGVLYSHRSIMLHAMAFLLTSNGVGVAEHDTVLPVVPMFHACAWGFPFSCTLIGSKQVLPGPHLDAESLLELLATEHVTITAGVPTVMLGILQALDAGVPHGPLSLRTIVVGGSAVPRFLVKAFDERYGIQVMHSWGMTEMSPLGSTAVLTSAWQKASKEDQYDYSIRQGLPVPFVEMRARSESGLIPWDGISIGELEVRGPWVASAYYRDESPSGKFTDDGWFRTGDMVAIYPDGSLEIKDRSKDVIKSGGEWISSIMLENLLMGHDCVLEAAVIAVPDAKWMERPFAYVVLRAGRNVTIDELKNFLADKVAKFWVPEGYAFIEAIPKTSVGKFSKVALRERYARDNA